jgi:coenzyme F420-0:L-glutamate ligase/coenzyme F420-1:gamma-L-glutamate ligase
LDGTSPISIHGLAGFPNVRPGDSIAALILASLRGNTLELRDGDVIVVAQKIISKAERRLVRLASITPSAEALALAARCAKDPRLVELILRESSSVLRVAPSLLIVVHRRGWVMAHAGIDQSNIEDNEGDEFALLLPEDPDASAEALRVELASHSAADIGVIINDSFGRPWRLGVTGVALGVAGWPALVDRRGSADLYGRPLNRTQVAHADELAAAASLMQGQAAEGRPVTIIRGAPRLGTNGSARDLLRPAELDLFR